MTERQIDATRLRLPIGTAIVCVLAVCGVAYQLGRVANSIDRLKEDFAAVKTAMADVDKRVSAIEHHIDKGDFHGNG